MKPKITTKEPTETSKFLILILNELLNMGMIKAIEAYEIHRIRYRKETKNSLPLRSLEFRRREKSTIVENINIGIPKSLFILIFLKFLIMNRIQ